MNETLQIIRQRRSCRKYLEKPVPDDVVEIILDAGMHAPCAMNRHDRNFTVITSVELLEALNQEAKAIAVKTENRYFSIMAQSENYNIFHNAPVVIVISASDDKMMESGCAAAAENMLLAAESLGYGGCWIGFSLFPFQGKRKEIFLAQAEIPKGYKPYCVISIGVRDGDSVGEREIRSNTVNYVR